MENNREYWPNGKLRYEYTLDKNGKGHGVCKTWHENGQPESEDPYQNGKWHGVRKYWYQNGQLLHKLYYLYDKKVNPEEYRKHQLIVSLSGLNNED